jgi:hypothetical protein
MAGTYDNEQQRVIDRIKCLAFRKTIEAGAEFIDKKWIARRTGSAQIIETLCVNRILNNV